MRYEIDIEVVKRMYSIDGARVQDIADRFGCSVHNIKRILSTHKIVRGEKTARRAWNKGLTKHSDERLAKLASDRVGDKNPMAGKTPWNEGLTKDTDKRVKSVSDKLKGREFSQETKEKMAAAKRGMVSEQANNWQGGKSYTNHLGYLMNRFTRDGRRWYEHRWLAWRFIISERDFEEDEEVHHIDRDRLNNDLGNLMVLKAESHNALHRAIDNGATTRDEQIAWLRDNGITFEVYDGKNKESDAA